MINCTLLDVVPYDNNVSCRDHKILGVTIQLKELLLLNDDQLLLNNSIIEKGELSNTINFISLLPHVINFIVTITEILFDCAPDTGLLFYSYDVEIVIRQGVVTSVIFKLHSTLVFTNKNRYC